MRAALNALALIKFADKAYESIPQEENKRFSEKKKKKYALVFSLSCEEILISRISFAFSF